jgi:hypothetical protein
MSNGGGFCIGSPGPVILREVGGCWLFGWGAGWLIGPWVVLNSWVGLWVSGSLVGLNG